MRTCTCRAAGDGNGYLPPGEKATFIAAAQYLNGLTREQVSILTGYKRSSRDAYIQRLIGKGYLEVRGANVFATDSGVAALGSDYEPLPTARHSRSIGCSGRRPGRPLSSRRRSPSIRRRSTASCSAGTTGCKRSSRDAHIQRLQARQLLEKGGDR